MQNVFVSGGTGYMGKALVKELMTRPGSEGKVAAGAEAVSGNALEAESFTERIPPADTFVHLVGTSHPAPWKEREFRAVDLASLRASAGAAASAGVSHFFYVSVAHPALVTKAYIRVRTECEEILASQPFPCTILRPWYVLGPGHWWPVSLKPIYSLLERFRQREKARDAWGWFPSHRWFARWFGQRRIRPRERACSRSGNSGGTAQVNACWSGRSARRIAAGIMAATRISADESE